MSSVSAWWRSLRAYSFPASIMPVLLSVVLAVQRGAGIHWWALAAFLTSAVLFHAATNVLNDYYDFRHGVDVPGDPDPTHAITQGIVSPRFMLISGNGYFVLALLLGIMIARYRGTGFLVTGLAGASGAYFYTGARFSLKYRALGDATVFLLMGPAMVFLGYWAITGAARLETALAALPLAFMVTLILHGNNLRDIEVDSSAGVDTVARRLGFERSRTVFVGLLVVAYLAVAALAVAAVVPWATIAVVFSLPPALRLALRVQRANSGGDLIDLPLRSAQLHMLFSLFYLAGTVAPQVMP
jgi:1,4-dihydroxy-2-naphthoate octaprenyltransferase